LEIRFHKRQVSFLVVKTVECKRGITLSMIIATPSLSLLDDYHW